MMQGISGLSTTKGNTEHQRTKSESGTLARIVVTGHHEEVAPSSSSFSSSSPAVRTERPRSRCPAPLQAPQAGSPAKNERLRTGTASSAENSWSNTCLLTFCSFSSSFAPQGSEPEGIEETSGRYDHHRPHEETPTAAQEHRRQALAAPNDLAAWDPLGLPAADCALWWRAAASSIRTVKRSWRRKARNWRSLRRRGTPDAAIVASSHHLPSR